MFFIQPKNGRPFGTRALQHTQLSKAKHLKTRELCDVEAMTGDIPDMFWSLLGSVGSKLQDGQQAVQNLQMVLKQHRNCIQRNCKLSKQMLEIIKPYNCIMRSSNCIYKILKFIKIVWKFDKQKLETLFTEPGSCLEGFKKIQMT